jgi:hypothetical protein
MFKFQNGKVRYLNFAPTAGFQIYVNGLVDRLIDLSPSDAALSSAIERIGSRFQCKLEIISSKENFKALCESTDARRAIEEARRRIMRELVRWRETRKLSLTFMPREA